MILEEKVNNAIETVRTMNGDEYVNNIQTLLDKFNKSMQLKILEGIIESDGIPLMNDESLETEYLNKLKSADESDKKEIISEILNTLSMSDVVLTELRKYKEVLLDLRSENRNYTL